MKKIDLDDYNEYLKIQKKRTRQKWGGKTFRKRFPAFIKLMKEVYKITGNVKEICCMGIRNGNEYFAFQGEKGNWDFRGLEDYKDSIIYGVDLDGRVTGVGKNCYAYDFNKLPKDWENKFEMVYSNSLDHAFDVKQTLNEWYRLAKPDGFIMLELSMGNLDWADIHSFEYSDVDLLFDKNKFEILKVWDKPFAVLSKVKK